MTIKEKYFAWLDRRLKRKAAMAGKDVCKACGTVLNVITARVPASSMEQYGKFIKCPCCGRPIRRKWVTMK